MSIKTTTIGAYPKPNYTPIRDWFLQDKSDEEKKQSKGLLSNWDPKSEDHKIYEEKDEEKEKLFLKAIEEVILDQTSSCLLYTSPSPRDLSTSRMPSSA